MDEKTETLLPLLQGEGSWAASPAHCHSWELPNSPSLWRSGTFLRGPTQASPHFFQAGCARRRADSGTVLLSSPPLVEPLTWSSSERAVGGKRSGVYPMRCLCVGKLLVTSWRGGGYSHLISGGDPK